MNLSESIKYVFKTKKQEIFVHLWKEDVKFILKNLKEEMPSFRPGKIDFKNVLTDARQSMDEATKIVTVVPERVRNGFKYFVDDFIGEMDLLPDQKQKTVFSIKVLGALSHFTLSTFYGIKGRTDGHLMGIGKYRNRFTQFLMASLIFKMCQMIMTKFLGEVEKELTDPEEKKKLRFLKSLFSEDTWKDEPFEENEQGDRAFELVESLKRYILTGQRA